MMGGAGGRFWVVGAVPGGYGDVRYLRKGESRGGFRSAAENDGQAGGVTCGAGMMRIREWWAGTPRRGVPATHLARDLRMCPLRIHLLSFAQFWLALAGSGCHFAHQATLKGEVRTGLLEVWYLPVGVPFKWKRTCLWKKRSD